MKFEESPEHPRALEKKSVLASSFVYYTSSTDAAVGACILSAAELDSSKNYVETEEGCQLAYLVSNTVVVNKYCTRQYACHDLDNNEWIK
jgi:hypothetical protein